MKRFIGAVLIGYFLLAGFSFGQTDKASLTGKISISGAWALYPMVLKWAEEFQKVNPGVKIDVQAGGAGKGIADVLAGMVDFGMVSRDVHPQEMEKGALPIAVTKDGVVATISAKNPFLNDILKKGLTKSRFLEIWITGNITTWGQVLGTQDKAAVHVFTRSDACGAAETWAAYLEKDRKISAASGSTATLAWPMPSAAILSGSAITTSTSPMMPRA